jgi:hypothetical protein
VVELRLEAPSGLRVGQQSLLRVELTNVGSRNVRLHVNNHELSVAATADGSAPQTWFNGGASPLSVMWMHGARAAAGSFDPTQLPRGASQRAALPVTPSSAGRAQLVASVTGSIDLVGAPTIELLDASRFRITTAQLPVDIAP